MCRHVGLKRGQLWEEVKPEACGNQGSQFPAWDQSGVRFALHLRESTHKYEYYLHMLLYNSVYIFLQYRLKINHMEELYVSSMFILGPVSMVTNTNYDYNFDSAVIYTTIHIMAHIMIQTLIHYDLNYDSLYSNFQIFVPLIFLK